jgi:hypothetical protein
MCMYMYSHAGLAEPVSFYFLQYNGRKVAASAASAASAGAERQKSSVNPIEAYYPRHFSPRPSPAINNK